MQRLSVALLVALTLWTPSDAAILLYSAEGTLEGSYETLADAAGDTSVLSTGATVVVTSYLTDVQSNLAGTWPAGLKLRVEKGGMINNTIAFSFAAGSSFDAVDYPVFGLFYNNNFTGPVTGLALATPQMFETYIEGDYSKGPPISCYNRIALQKAADSVADGGTLYFPQGRYLITGDGDCNADTPCFINIRHTINIRGDPEGGSVIIGISGTKKQHIFYYSIGSSASGDIRGLAFEGITAYFTDITCGGSAVYSAVALPMYDFTIRNCILQGGQDPAIRIGPRTAYTHITGNTLQNGIKFDGSASGQEISCNLIFGIQPGVIFDLPSGATTHTVTGNIIVSRDGAIRVINGSQIVISYNQCEQGVIDRVILQNNVNQNGTMLAIEGAAYQSDNITIVGNNFGGGDYVENLIAIKNATRTYIDGNQLLHTHMTANPALSGRGIYFATANATNNTVGDTNYFEPFHDLKTTNAIVGVTNAYNCNVVYSLATLPTYANRWKASSTYDSIRLLPGGVVKFSGQFTGGSTGTGKKIATLPVYFRPTTKRTISVGTGNLSINTNGDIIIETRTGLTSALCYLDGIYYKK